MADTVPATNRMKNARTRILMISPKEYCFAKCNVSAAGAGKAMHAQDRGVGWY